MATTKKTSVKSARKPAAKKAAKPNIELRRLCFEILARYFPYNSGKDTPAWRMALKLPSEGQLSNAQWKKGACDYLAENLG